MLNLIKVRQVVRSFLYADIQIGMTKLVGVYLKLFCERAKMKGQV
jgi:hypothetical protein